MKLKPLFKWTGGKNKMRVKYDGMFFPQQEYTRFVDAFYGAGAVTHWVNDMSNDNVEFVINDFNQEMVDIYTQLRDHADDFIELTEKLEDDYLLVEGKENRKDFYNVLKMKHIDEYEEQGRLQTAVNLHFMMKTNFNGWWKIYNYSNGRYATPPGVMEQKKKFIDIQNLKNTANFFKERCTIVNGDFDLVRPYVNEKTWVYFDPPYRDSTTEYTDDGFNEKDQIRLCEFFKECVDKGAFAALSNKEIGDGFFEDNLGDFYLNKMAVKYTAGRGTTLNKVMEILVTSYDASENKINLEDFAL